jgi:hypothetical protein
MAIVTPAGFKITSTEPVDFRITLPDSASRFALSPFNVYEGLIVYQQDNNIVYVLVNTGSVDNNSGWQQVGSGASLTGGTTDYIAVWSGSTALTTGSLYNDTINSRIGINKSDPGYALDVNGDFRVSGSAESGSIIYHEKNKHGVILPIEVAANTAVTLFSFKYTDTGTESYYRGLFLDYEIEVYSDNGNALSAVRCGTLKATIYYRNAYSQTTARIQTNENTTQEFHFLTDSTANATTTENVTFILEFNGNNIDVKCNNTINNCNAIVQGEWKLISNT